ncbi:MAG: 3-deoxy-D-manno-octulosonic acid transferase [Chlorobium sp.]|uniref:3-deoxy-D-manno-octulosonic acid transferase n=1 Tax=Chlorobium sp. TaxID=1095 RepID=UPI0025B808B3|nr:glycosyltransferase N-terminal domain-containing protein [Chlorobium sp.]MCF8383644.1 3-deoxy-D-manno-octulosonic acid transferase [Chlorobium sp.]
MNSLALTTYTIISPLLFGAAGLISPLFRRLHTFTSLRKNLFEELEATVRSAAKPSFRLWVHAASVGEFEQARPVIAALQEKHPKITVYVSFLSDSGYNARKNFAGATAVFYLPVDTPANAKRLVSLLEPDILLLMRYDFWPNHLLAAKKSGARLILAAAVLQENSQYFNPLLKGFYRSIFNLFNHIYTVSAKDSRAFRDLFGCLQAETAGDPRFDQVFLRSRNPGKVAHLKPFYENRTVLIAGSIWPIDEALLLGAWQRLENSPDLVLVPHQVNTENIERLCRTLEERNIPFARVSSLDPAFDPEQQVLVIDETGYLAELYSIGSIAYVGGGFGVNVHNTLEPAVYGIPVLFGPRHHNSPEAEDLAEKGGATVVEDETSLLAALNLFMKDCAVRAGSGEAAGAFVKERTGATAIISRCIENYLAVAESA